jgi:hypothetical protein
MENRYTDRDGLGADNPGLSFGRRFVFLGNADDEF